MLRDVWPATPMPYLGFRTPEQAAKDGNAAIPLRAALCQYEQDRELAKAGLDFAALRARLKVEPEPAIDPSTVDLARLPLARLVAVPADRLDDDRLVLFYRRARRAMITDAMEAAARAIVARPHLFEKGQVDPVSGLHRPGQPRHQPGRQGRRPRPGSTRADRPTPLPVEGRTPRSGT